MKTILTALCILYGFIGTVHAGGIVIVSQSHREGRETVTIMGSGAIVKLGNGRLSVISCAHAGKDRRTQKLRNWDAKRHVDILIDGKSARGNILKLDDALDLSLIEADYDGDCDAYELASDEPPVGVMVWSGGFVQRKATGKWRQVKEYNNDHLKLDVGHEFGESGGPVLYQGYVVGIVQGTYDLPGPKGSTIRLREIRRFVAE